MLLGSGNFHAAMGGDHCRIELSSCEEFQNNTVVWEHLELGGVTQYMERIQGSNPDATKFFVKGWNGRTLCYKGMEFKIDEEFIVEVTGLSIYGRKFYRDRGVAKKAFANFFKFDEKKKLWEIGTGGYACKSLKLLWRDLVLAIMHYFMLEGRFSVVYSYHFMLLNQFRHKVLISFPFYLLLSMEKSIKDHQKNPKKVILHEGLMIMLFSHSKLKLILVSPKTPSKKGVKFFGYDIGDSVAEWEGSSEEEDSDCEEMSMDEGGFEEGVVDSEEWTKGYETDVELRETMAKFVRKTSKGKSKGPKKDKASSKRKIELVSKVEAPGVSVKPSLSQGKGGVEVNSLGNGGEVPYVNISVENAFVGEIFTGKVGVMENSPASSFKVPEDVGALNSVLVGEVNIGADEMNRSRPMEVQGLDSVKFSQYYPIDRVVKMERLEVLVDLANLPDKERIKVDVVEVEESPVEEDEEQNVECSDSPENLEPNVMPPVNWDNVNMSMFYKMDEDGTQNFLSLVK